MNEILVVEAYLLFIVALFLDIGTKIPLLTKIYKGISFIIITLLTYKTLFI